MTRVALIVAALALIGAALWYLAAEDEPAAARPGEAAAPSAPPVSAAPPAVNPAAPRLPEPARPMTAPTQQDPAMLAQIGRAQLEQGIEAKRSGEAEQARGLLEDAASALGKSIALSGDRVDPWTLQSMAQAQLELGHDVDAIGWADRALQQLRLGSGDDYTQFRAAQLTMSVGIVYYRAGQKQTGIAYMDQAISLAPTGFDREDFEDLKEETIGG